MPSLDTLLTISFVFGFVPIFIFFLIYAFRTRWYSALVGRVIFALSATSVASYGLSTATRVWPESLETAHGFILGGIFWAVLTIFVWTQVRGRKSE